MLMCQQLAALFKGALEAHSAAVRGVAVSEDGRLAISASGDHTLKVWELGSGLELMTFTADAPLYRCAVSSGGKTIVAGDALGRVHFLEVMQKR